MARTGDLRPDPYEIEFSDDTQHQWKYIQWLQDAAKSVLERMLLGHERLSSFQCKTGHNRLLPKRKIVSCGHWPSVFDFPCFRRKVLEFSYASSPKGGIDITLGSITVHIPIHYSVHHPVVQMVLFTTVLLPGNCRFSYSMVPKAILHIMDTSSSDASSTDCPIVYSADWDPERSYNWLSSPVLLCISNESRIYGDCWSPKPDCINMVVDGRMGNAGADSVVGRSRLHPPLKCKVEHQLISTVDVDPQMTCLEQAPCWLGDPGFHSDIVSSRTESIGSMLLASNTTDVQFYCQPEEQQCVLKNPGNEKNYLPYELDQAILSKHPEANEILVGDTKPGHLRTICHSEERHDPKMYALGMAQSGMPGDVGGSETSAPSLWLDSGATHHVVGDDGILSNIHDPPAEMVVAVADGFRLRVAKVGDIQIPDIKIADVHFVPGLDMNLISVRQLAKNKIVTTFYENHAELWLKGTQIGGAILDESGCLYKLRYLQHDMK